jgi:hypothetical protein
VSLGEERDSLLAENKQKQTMVEQADSTLRASFTQLQEERNLLNLKNEQYKAIIATQKDLI